MTYYQLMTQLQNLREELASVTSRATTPIHFRACTIEVDSNLIAGEIERQIFAIQRELNVLATANSNLTIHALGA